MTSITPSAQTADTARALTANISLIQDEITETLAGVDKHQLATLAAHVEDAKRIFIAGAGRSGLVLRMAAMRLMHLGLTVHVAGDTTTPAIAAGDLLIVASGSGTTSGTVKSAETAANVDARIAAITTNRSSPLALLADVVIEVPAAQKTDHSSSATSQYSGSLFEQALFLATESVFQTLWESAEEPAEQLWLRHANLE
ncbi:6-phospho-3-hexuloisomerase [Paenarthrobacter sp. NPDC058040]|uniref:6-phospho-3-hexuloisomerase n=1 Tax=unclassified Paenarthrobacter TaxID=2634190 RepID=UPI0036D8FD3D